MAGLFDFSTDWPERPWVAMSSFCSESFDYFQLETECLLRRKLHPLLPCRRRFRKGTVTAVSLSEPLKSHKTRVGG